MTPLTCFKSYDIRGQLGHNLDAGIARRIGRAFVDVMTPGTVVTGRDCRASSLDLQTALNEGLRDGGADVLDIGLCGTEEVYFATDHLGTGAGLMVTASHNPIDYNGIKLVRAGARPISGDNGLDEIRARAEEETPPPVADRGTLETRDPRAAYVDRVLSFVTPADLKPLKVLVNAGNGSAGPTFDALATALDGAGAPLDFIRMHHDPDGTFPNGIPNPLLPENQPVTAEAVRHHGADLGIAWDGDFDRCFLFDEDGTFIDGEYIVGLLAAAFLAQEKGAKIVHDPRVVWNTQDIVEDMGGEAVVSRTGHAHLKAKMREVDAAYGGEMSAHHYFRNFMYCDSGMIPWLLVIDHMSRTGQPLSALVAERKARFPSSGEINFKLKDADAALAAFEAEYLAKAKEVDRLDGLSLDFGDWRANLRKSNTEPVLRLNVETKGNRMLLEDKVAAISGLVSGF